VGEHHYFPRDSALCHAARVDELIAIREELSGHITGFDQVFEPAAEWRCTRSNWLTMMPARMVFLIEGFNCRIGYATDLGRVTRELIERFVDLDMLAIESNYDPQMQFDSARPSSSSSGSSAARAISPTSRRSKPCGKSWIVAKRSAQGFRLTSCCCTGAAMQLPENRPATVLPGCPHRGAAHVGRAVLSVRNG